MKQNFLKHFAIIGGGTFISMILGFFTTPLITRLVDPIEYGQFSIFTLYSNLAVMVLYLGLDQSLVRYFYEIEKETYRRALLFKCVRIPVIISTIVIVVAVLTQQFDLWHFELGKSIFILLCIYTLIQIIYRFALLIVRLQYKTKLYSLLGIIQKVTYIILLLPTICFFKINNEYGLIIATIIAAFVCMIISIISERRMWNFKNIKVEYCKVSNFDLLQYAYPYVLSMGVTTLFQTIDKISLNIYGSYLDVGIYASTMTLINIFSIVQNSFNTLWAPMSMEYFIKNKDDKTFYQRGNQAITVVMFFIGISLILCKDIFAILLGEKYRQAAYILPFLIFNPVMYTISETTVSGLVFMKKSKLQVLVAVIACSVNIAGNIMLVPRLGCQGAAISTGLSYIVFFTMRTILSNRYFYVDFHLRKFYLLTLIVVIYAFYNTFNKFNIVSIFGYIVCLVALILLYKETIIWGIEHIIRLYKKDKKRG